MVLVLAGARVPLNGGICGYAAKIGRIVNLSNAGADWRFDASVDTRPGLQTRSLLMVPVRTRRGQTSAILEAINCTRTDSPVFNTDDETIMSVLAGWYNALPLLCLSSSNEIILIVTNVCVIA
jgi:GAF domain-containing protein